jgi:hypothetical protein
LRHRPVSLLVNSELFIIMNFSLRGWKQYRKLTLLVEGRIDDARKAAPIISAVSKLAKQANPREPDFIDNVVAFDPTGNQKYLVWTVKAMEKNIRDSMSDRILDAVIEYAQTGHEGLGPDDVTSIQRAAAEDWDKVWRLLIDRYGLFKDVIQDFHKFVKRKIIRGEEADINKYVDWSALDARNEQAREELDEKAKQKRLRKSVDVIYADDDWFIFEPLTHEASCHYAQRHGSQGTKWCISSDDFPNYWEEFAAADNKFVFVFNSRNRKFSIQNNEWDRPQNIAGHTANHGTTVWDEVDDPMSFNDFRAASKIPTTLVEKITDHYADKHGMDVQDELSSNEEELEDARSMWERLKEEDERVEELNMDITLELADDFGGGDELQVHDLGFTIYLPRTLFKDKHSAGEAFDDAEDTIQEMIDNNHNIDGYADGVSFDSDPIHPAHYAIHVSYGSNTFSSASDFYNYISDFIHNVYSEVGYEFHDEEITIGDLPSLTKKVFYAMAVEDPDATVADLPEYEHFSYVLEEHPAFDVAMTSPRFKVGQYPADVTSSGRSDFSQAVKERLIKWLSSAISAEQLELGRTPNKELAAQRKENSESTLSRWLEVHPRVDWSRADARTMDLVVRVFQELPPEKGSTPLLATEIMDENWGEVRQIAVRQFAKSFPETPLTENKSPRKIRIKIK